MYYHEEYKDLFSVDRNKYALAHCINAEFILGRGIAIEFNNHFNLQHILRTRFSQYSANYFINNSRKGYCIYEPENRIFNLVTKAYHYNKPTYVSLISALIDMKHIAELNKINAIAMPKIGCGLDRLKWPKVKSIIQDIFQDTNIEILVCIQ